MVNAYVELASTCLGYHRQQRVMSHPVLVHCLAGSGKTAVFLLVAAAMAEMEIGQMPDLIPNMIDLGAQVCQQRKGILREKEHFKLIIQGVIKHARDLLIKKGKLSQQETHVIETGTGNNSEIGDLSTISTQLGFEIQSNLVTEEEIGGGPPKWEEPERKPTPEKSGIFSMADLSKFSDFNLVGPSSESPNKKKFSKQDFLNAKKGLQQDTANPNDPLSQLDPLWSLK